MAVSSQLKYLKSHYLLRSSYTRYKSINSKVIIVKFNKVNSKKNRLFDRKGSYYVQQLKSRITLLNL